MTLSALWLSFALRIALACLALLGAIGSAQAADVLWYRSVPGDGTAPQVIDAASPAWSISGSHSDGREVMLEIRSTDTVFFLLQMTSDTGLLAPGPYEEAARASFRGNSPGLELMAFGAGINCPMGGGRFVILESAFGPGGTIERFAANFEQQCAFSPGRVFGEIRLNSSVPVGDAYASMDTLPDLFALRTQSPARAGSVVQSNPITVYGISAPVAMSVLGGEYSLNGRPYTSQPTTVFPLDEVVVRTRASWVAGSRAQAVLDIGGRAAELAVTTFEEGEPLSGLHFRSSPGDWIGDGATRLYLAPRHAVSVSRNPWNGVRVEIAAVGGEDFKLDLGLPGDATPMPGTYENATRLPFHAPGEPGLEFTGNGRGCNQIAGRFTVLEAAYDGSGAVQRFAADFEQRCEVTGPPLWGQVRFNSAIPFTALLPGPCAVGDSDGDGMSDCVEHTEGRDPLARDNDLFLDHRLFAMQQYRDLLGREGDAGGIDHWTAQLAGAMSRAQMVETFLGSAEFEGRIAPVTRLYFAYFRRIPDHGGLQHWIGQYAAGVSLEAISELFAQSEEFRGRYGALDDAQFVGLVYRSVMGRAPDASGLAFWTGRLARRELTRGEMMLAFSESAEYRTLIGAEVLVTMSYVGMLRRAPEEEGFAFWVGYLDAGQSPQALIDGFLRATEYRARFLP